LTCRMDVVRRLLPSVIEIASAVSSVKKVWTDRQTDAMDALSTLDYRDVGVRN